MTVVTKYALATSEYPQDAKIYNSSGQWLWGNAAADTIAFVVGEWLLFRFSLDVPKGATITTATWRFEYSQKDAAPAQTTNMTLHFEQVDNSAPWPYTDGTLIGGQTPTFLRNVDAGSTFVISYPGGTTPGTDFVTQTVTSQVQALVNRAGWEAGNYITLAMLCTAEGSGANLSIQMAEAWWATYRPVLEVTYTYDDDTAAGNDVNLLRNEVLTDTLDLGTQEMSGNAQGGVTYDIVPWGRDGGNCQRMIAHPPAGQGARQAIVYQAISVAQSTVDTYTFSGWFYNPKSNPTNFHCELTFRGGAVDYPQRDEWTPFSTTPVTVGAGGTTYWCSAGLAGGAAEGNWVLLDDLCLQRTNATEMPWTGATADKWNADYAARETATHGVSVRRNRRRTHVLLSSVSRPRRNYVRDKQGLWVRADQQQMGTTWDSYGALTSWDAVSGTITWDTVG